MLCVRALVCSGVLRTTHTQVLKYEMVFTLKPKGPSMEPLLWCVRVTTHTPGDFGCLKNELDYLMITKECIYNVIWFELSRDGVVLDKDEWNR